MGSPRRRKGKRDAWFTTKATANFNTATLTVSTLSELKIKAKAVVPSEGSITGNDSNSVTGINTALGSVSSNFGRTFYAPTELGGTEFAEVSTITSNKYVGYAKYNLYVYTEATDQDGKILQLKITATNNAGSAVESPLVDWYRVGVYTTAAGDDTSDAHTGGDIAADEALTKVYSNAKQEVTTAPADPNPGTKYISGLTGTTPGYGYRATEALPTSTAVTIPNFVTSSSARAYRHLTVAVWMEGCAAEDQNTAGGKTLKVNFEFELVDPPVVP